MLWVRFLVIFCFRFYWNNFRFSFAGFAQYWRARARALSSRIRSVIPDVVPRPQATFEAFLSNEMCQEPRQAALAIPNRNSDFHSREFLWANDVGMPVMQEKDRRFVKAGFLNTLVHFPLDNISFFSKDGLVRFPYRPSCAGGKSDYLTLSGGDLKRFRLVRSSRYGSTRYDVGRRTFVKNIDVGLQSMRQDWSGAVDGILRGAGVPDTVRHFQFDIEGYTMFAGTPTHLRASRDKLEVGQFLSVNFVLFC